MKKYIFSVMFVFATACMVSCGNSVNGANSTENDSTVVDTVVTDSVVTDSVVTDSVF